MPIPTPGLPQHPDTSSEHFQTPLSSPVKSHHDMVVAQQRLIDQSPKKASAQKPECEFGNLDTHKVKVLPAYKWDRNSCWLDTSLESLWCAMAFHGCLDEFHKLVQAEKSKQLPSPLYYLSLHFLFRKQWGISMFHGSQSGAAEEITQLRNDFRQLLFKIGAMRHASDIYDHQMLFVCI